MKNMIVGIDFDEKTEVLIEKAQDLAEKFNAKLWLLHAVAPLPEFVGIDVTPHYAVNEQKSVLDNERVLINGYVEKLKSKGVEAEGILIQMATVEAILEESKERNVDLIICGHHEHNFLYNIFFGSVSTAIIKRSSIPVIVFPLG